MVAYKRIIAYMFRYYSIISVTNESNILHRFYSNNLQILVSFLFLCFEFISPSVINKMPPISRFDVLH